VSIFRAIVALAVLDKNAAAFSARKNLYELLCNFLKVPNQSHATIEWCIRVVIVLLCFVKVAPKKARDGGDEDDPPPSPRGSFTQRRSLTSSSAAVSPLPSPPTGPPGAPVTAAKVPTRNALRDEPSGLATSSPRRKYHNEFLFDVVSPHFSQTSANPVYGGAEPSFVPRQTYPNIPHFLDTQLHVILAQVLNQHSSTELLVWLIFEAFAVISIEKLGSSALVTIGEIDLCELICATLDSFLTRSQRVEESAVKIIANLSVFGESSELLGQRGACGLVVQFLRRYYAESPESVRVGCNAIAYLCKRNANNRIAIAASGGGEVLFACLQKFVFTFDIIPYVVHAIKCFCTHNKINSSSMSSFGTMDFIIENLIGTELITGDLSILGSCLWCVGHVAPLSITLLSSPQVIAFVVDNLKSHLADDSVLTLVTNSYVVMSACEAVYALCLYAPANRKTLAKMEVIPHLLLTIRYFETDENILHSALMSLANLIDGQQENQNTVKPTLILKAMQGRYDSNIAVRGALAALLGIVHNNPSHPDKFNSVAAARIIFKGICLHLQDEVVAKRGCSLIAILASQDKSYQRILGSEGGCGVVMDVMGQHDGNVIVMREACWALCSLSHKYDSNRASIIQNKGIELLTSVLRRYLGNESIVVWACGCLANVAAIRSSANSAKFLEFGSCAVIVEILQMYGIGGTVGSESVVRYVCWAVGNLALSRVLNETLGDAGACEQLVLVLLKHIEIATVAQLACEAMKNLARLPANKQRLLDSGVVRTIDDALQKHASNETVSDIIRKTKSTLLSSGLFSAMGFGQSTRSIGADSDGGEEVHSASGESVGADDMAQAGSSEVKS
jgi:hypothetical protein